MEYEAVAAKERLTGRGYFTATGDTSAVDLGNIQMFNLDFGIKRKEHFKARRGVLVADRFDAYSSIPKWEITGDEFATSLLHLIFLGTAVADFSQGALTATTFNWTMAAALKGKTLDIGKFAITNASLTTPGSKVEGYTADYVIDRESGKLYIPASTTIPNGAAVVTYDCPALTYNKLLPPLSTLNRSGNIQLIEEDEYATGPKTIHDFACILSAESGGQTKPDDYKEFKLTAIVSDPTTWSMRRRAA